MCQERELGEMEKAFDAAAAGLNLAWTEFRIFKSGFPTPKMKSNLKFLGLEAESCEISSQHWF